MTAAAEHALVEHNNKQNRGAVHACGASLRAIAADFPACSRSSGRLHLRRRGDRQDARHDPEQLRNGRTARRLLRKVEALDRGRLPAEDRRRRLALQILQALTGPAGQVRSRARSHGGHSRPDARQAGKETARGERGGGVVETGVSDRCDPDTVILWEVEWKKLTKRAQQFILLIDFSY